MNQDDSNGTDEALVLVVDDDQDVRDLLFSVFEEAGFDVRVARGGHEAIELLSTIHPEVIISDVVMPRMSGYELCRKLRNSDKTDIPFVFCSALSDLPERIEGLQLGADDYIAKPVDAEELVLRVRALIDRSRRGRALGKQARLQADASALRGSLEETGVPELLQLIDFVYRGDACLSLEVPNGLKGQIWTCEGSLLHAYTHGWVGAKAFYRMLGWSSGKFRIDRLRFEGTPTLSAKIGASLVAGLTYLDEYKRLLDSFPSDSHTFVRSSSPDLLERDLEANLSLVLGVVEQHSDLDATLAHSPISELETLRALASLTEKGAIRVSA